MRKFTRAASWIMFSCMSLVLSGCGESEKPPTTQVAARVNGQDLSIHQINTIMGRIPNISDDKVQTVKNQVLSQLVDQQLAVSKALELKLDRNPDVLQKLELARREVLTQAYFTNLSKSLSSPTDQDVEAFIREHPALFSERKTYDFTELALSGKNLNQSDLEKIVSNTKSFEAVTADFKAAGIEVAKRSAVRQPEDLPLDAAAQFLKQKIGGFFLYQAPNGSFSVIRVNSAQPAPWSDDVAKQRTRVFLANKAARDLIKSSMDQLKKSAEIEYFNGFGGVASAPSSNAFSEKPSATDRAVTTDPLLDKGVQNLK